MMAMKVAVEAMAMMPMMAVVPVMAVPVMAVVPVMPVAVRASPGATGCESNGCDGEHGS
jgi:hypothetical protein